MSNGIFPDEALISIGAAGAVSSDCTNMTGFISNYSESGGEKDTEAIPVFGGGNIDKETPRSQIEVSLDVQMIYGTDSVAFDTYKYGSGLTSATEGVVQVIYVQWTDGTYYYTRAYNNAKGVTFSPTSSADGNLTGTMTFKLSPTDQNGTANLQIDDAAASTISW